MKTSQDDVELVLTGGGSIIVPEKLKGISNVIRPPHYTLCKCYWCSFRTNKWRCRKSIQFR